MDCGHFGHMGAASHAEAIKPVVTCKNFLLVSQDAAEHVSSFCHLLECVVILAHGSHKYLHLQAGESSSICFFFPKAASSFSHLKLCYLHFSLV